MRHDVIVAGAGPVGLFLACELRLGGASVLVLERDEDPAAPLKGLPFGLRGLSAPTQEALHRRGLLEALPPLEFQRAGPARDAAHWVEQPRVSGGHFAGIPFFLDQVDEAQWPYRLPGAAGTHRATTMAQLEASLAARAAKLGVEIRRGVAVEHVAQTDSGVTVHAGGHAFDAGWLVGCDGGRSTVRKNAGFAFVGTEPEFTGYSLEVELEDASFLQRGRHHTPTGMYTYAPPGTFALVDFDGGAFHRTQPITREHVQAVMQRVTCTDVRVAEVRQAATWTDRAFQATSYRNGRVLLAGDAAHLHSPLGGQGLNLGLGDAMNLGWKLAAVIRGDSPTDLLDTYTQERHPIGARVLDWSRAQVALMRPSESSRALEGILRDLIDTRDGATYFASRVWGVQQRYDLGDAHPLVGRSAPDFEFEEGERLADWLREGQGVLLEFAEAAAGEVRSARVRHIVARPKDTLGLHALLVRPDGIVAWATDTPGDLQAASPAIERWFGSPA